MNQEQISSQLIGVWSADHMYGPGAQSDDILIFKPDGTGRFDFINFVLCSAMEFTWNINAVGRLSIIESRTFQITDSGVEETNTNFQLNQVPFQIALEETKAGCAMPVLRLKFMEGVADHFGFVRADFTGFENPNFD